jgi:hypothetical protein
MSTNVFTSLTVLTANSNQNANRSNCDGVAQDQQPRSLTRERSIRGLVMVSGVGEQAIVVLCQEAKGEQQSSKIQPGLNSVQAHGGC